MNYSYDFPNNEAFLHTLRRYLSTNDHADTASLLAGSTCEFSSITTFGQRSYAYLADLTIYVPLERVSAFTDDIRKEITDAANVIMPPRSGYEIWSTDVAPHLEVPSDDDNQPGLNAGVVGSSPTYEHDGLRFRSRTEIRIYDVLKSRRVLFFPNAAAVLGATEQKREPDFLVCQSGKWGILEVMGEPYHPAETAMRDHERARLFNNYGVNCIHFYDAAQCYNSPVDVVNDFLGRLASNNG